MNKGVTKKLQKQGFATSAKQGRIQQHNSLDHLPYHDIARLLRGCAPVALPRGSSVAERRPAFQGMPSICNARCGTLRKVRHLMLLTLVRASSRYNESRHLAGTPCPDWCDTWICHESWCRGGQRPEPCTSCCPTWCPTWKCSESWCRRGGKPAACGGCSGSVGGCADWCDSCTSASNITHNPSNSHARSDNPSLGQFPVARGLQ